MFSLARTVLPSVTLLFVGSAVHAQSWAADLYAGRAHYGPIAANVETTSIVGALRYGSPELTWAYVSAAAPLDDGAGAWAALGVTHRLPLRFTLPLRTGVDLGGHGFVNRDPVLEQTGAGATLEAGLFGETLRGRTRTEARLGLRQYIATQGDVRASKTALDAGLRLEAMQTSSLRVGASARWVQAAEGGYPSFAVDAAALAGPLQVVAGVEQWFGEGVHDTGWGVTVTMPLQVLDAWAAVRRQARDPLYWNTPHRSWSIGITRRLGRAPPALRPVKPQAGGRARVQLPRSAADRAVYVAGDFTGWQPQPMRLAGDHWELELTLGAGVYHYAFVDTDGRWFVPDSVPGRVDDGMGGHVAVLVVQ